MKTQWLSAATIGLSLVAASTAGASYTSSYTPLKQNISEVGVADVLSALYGGTFEQASLGFTNGDKSFSRVPDDADQRWTGDFQVRVVGRFSGHTQSLGALAGGQFQHLVAADGIGFASSPEETTVTLNGEPLIRYGNTGTHSSIPSQNEDERDHLVTFELDNPGQTRVWVLFWEDLDLGPGITKGRSISDFNDLVVTLRATDIASAPPIAVPLPPAFYVGLATCGLGAYLVRRRMA